MDVDKSSLQRAKDAITKLPQEERWETLDVALYKGDIRDRLPDWQKMQATVLTEVYALFCFLLSQFTYSMYPLGLSI